MSKPSVLVVDDSQDDLMLMRMAVSKLPFDIDLKTLSRGEDAICYLQGEGIYADRTVHPMPRLLIVDLKMPRVSGFDVLTALGKIHVEVPSAVVMSSSRLAQDVEKAFSLGAVAYHMKPAQFTDLCEMMMQIVSKFCGPDARLEENGVKAAAISEVSA